jgi:hypothetical protein
LVATKVVVWGAEWILDWSVSSTFSFVEASADPDYSVISCSCARVTFTFPSFRR